MPVPAEGGFGKRVGLQVGGVVGIGGVCLRGLSSLWEGDVAEVPEFVMCEVARVWSGGEVAVAEGMRVVGGFVVVGFDYGWLWYR